MQQRMPYFLLPTIGQPNKRMPVKWLLMWRAISKAYYWLFGPEDSGHLWPRWLWLRALGLIFLSAFYSWFFQIRSLIGPSGLLPAGEYLQGLAEQFGAKRFWMVPSLIWLDSSDRALIALCVIGLVASVLLVLNVWPRGMIAICFVVFLSIISAAQDFASYQSDGMLLAAGFLSLFFAPGGLRPGLGKKSSPSRASLFLLQWLWFQIYFESGVVKWASGDPEWRHLTAIDHYYENGPLPDWIGWYTQQLPHRFQATVALATLLIEVFVVWMLFLPRTYRRICFCIVTPFQIAIILTANLAFLNYFTLALGFLLLDDDIFNSMRFRLGLGGGESLPLPPGLTEGGNDAPGLLRWATIGRRCAAYAIHGFFLSWIFYNTAAQILLMFIPILPLPSGPIEALEPFRISERYGLFAVMTTARYEIEFQGSRDGVNWVAYPFRYKPQDPREAPKIYAPYQPRFDWNLWFASLGGWREYPFVLSTEVHLLKNTPQVLALFAGNPFGNDPPKQVRAVEWQYWFTGLATKRKEGLWWRRKFVGLYAPSLEREPDGKIEMVQNTDGSTEP